MATTTTTTTKEKAKGGPPRTAAERLLAAGWQKVPPERRDANHPSACWLPPGACLADREEWHVIRREPPNGALTLEMAESVGRAVEVKQLSLRPACRMLLTTEQAFSRLLREESNHARP